MSKFDDFISGAKRFAGKAAKETVKLTDITAAKVKIKAEQSKLCDRYERLGKAAESYLRAKDTLPEQIAASLDEIEAVKSKIEKMEEELAEKKKKYAEENGSQADSAADEEFGSSDRSEDADDDGNEVS